MFLPWRSIRPVPVPRRCSSSQPTISALPISEVLTALVSIARDKGDFAAALRYARELLTLDPGNALLQALVSELEKKSRPYLVGLPREALDPVAPFAD
jgi:hypothetical protein